MNSDDFKLDRDWAAEAANVERYMARADLAGEAMEMRLNGATRAEVAAALGVTELEAATLTMEALLMVKAILEGA